MRELLASLEESGGDPSIPLAYLAGTAVELDPGETNAALRRAQLLLASGGDPRRDPDPDGRAVTALADDLDSPPARAALRDALALLSADAEGLPTVATALRELLADDGRAWRAFACALLADALSDES